MKTYLYSVFHCNLAFSLIPRDDFPVVVERCYRPLLDLAEEGFPIGIEMTAWTLQEVAAIDPAFVDRLRRLWAEGKLEFIGSGFSQAIMPLIPAEVNRWNLECGNANYKRLLGRRPATALVNEQTWSRGLADLYKEAGYETVIMDWDNTFRHNRYPREYLYRPQRAEGAGTALNLLWSNSIAFQKFQRCVHGEMPVEEYMDYLAANHSEDEDNSFVLYTNDAEVFDYRPGEGETRGGEFDRIRELLGRIRADRRFRLVTPGEVIKRFSSLPGAYNTVRLESVQTPVVTKKQEKYNAVRWAVTGRDSAHINAECHKVYRSIRSLVRDGAAPVETVSTFKEELCALWGSDFRTNTIDEKYLWFHNRLGWLKLETERLLKGASLRAVPALAVVGGGSVVGGSVARDLPDCCKDTNPFKVCDCGDNKCGRAKVTKGENTLRVETESVHIEFLTNKGCAIKSLVFPGVSDEAVLGTLNHGHYDDIGYGADFFSGHLIHVSREGAKTTDLGNVTDYTLEENTDCVRLAFRCDLSIGTLWKTYVIAKKDAEVEVINRLRVRGMTASTLRTGIFTFNPAAFDRKSLYYETVNGGPATERFSLEGATVRHDDPVSPTVSATGCLGATEGWVRVGDKDKVVEISTDKSALYSVPMVKYAELEGEAGRDFFLRILHSVGEVDDTSWWVWRGYNEISFTVTARKNEGNI